MIGMGMDALTEWWIGKSNEFLLCAYRDSFNRIISPVHIISHKQVIGVRTLSQYYVMSYRFRPDAKEGCSKEINVQNIVYK